jgi:CDGSH-type Zn-finger protein
MSHQEVVIVPYQDGPYLVRGPVRLLDQDGRSIELNRRTVALCRCGKSQMRPFCDGTHRMIGFRVSSAHEAPRARNPRPAERVAADALGGARSQALTPPDPNGRSRAAALRIAESMLIAARTELQRHADQAADGVPSPAADDGASQISVLVNDLTELIMNLRTAGEAT